MKFWGGIECTIRRIGDEYSEQLVRNGHKFRISDLELLNELDLEAIRYPVLMEQLAPNSLDEIDWRWTDARLPKLNAKIIAGLLHHGSGPRYTELLDDDFPEKLATYAEAAAYRYSWIPMWTPVNEPLTTARFMGLYGVWYPQKRTNHDMLKMLVQECKATVLAMRAIRKHNPKALLVQTEDLGKTIALQNLQYQADFENERRWLTFDILCGRFNEQSPIWGWVTSHLDADEFRWFWDNPCPPDILGINYYVTSERALDHRINLYPPEMVGGNGQDRYVDVEMVRVGEIDGFRGRIQEAWDRYKIPIAITEAHLGSTIDEQVKWLRDAWLDAIMASINGADVRGVTSWALFGSYDWTSLLREKRDHYEPGVFDVTSGEAEPTVLFDMIKAINNNDRKFEHKFMNGIGWWRRDERLLYPALSETYEKI